MAWDRFSPSGLDHGEANRLPHRTPFQSKSSPHKPAVFVRACDPKTADSEPRQKAELATWAGRNIEALVEFWEGRIFYDLDLRKRLRTIGHVMPRDFRLACVVLRALAPKVRSIRWSAGAYHLTFHRRTPDARRLVQRLTRLGFTSGITMSIAKPVSVREQFAIGCEFRFGSKRWRCTDVGTRVITAICLEDHIDPSWFNGPPYAVAETVIDEYDHPACEPI